MIHQPSCLLVSRESETTSGLAVNASCTQLRYPAAFLR
jgi:hypothetical protein